MGSAIRYQNIININILTVYNCFHVTEYLYLIVNPLNKVTFLITFK